MFLQTALLKFVFRILFVKFTIFFFKSWNQRHFRNCLHILFIPSILKKQVSKEMKINCNDFYWMIFYDFKKGLIWKECLASLHETFNNEAPSKKTVHIWFGKYYRGRASISDESPEGRSISAIIPNNIDAVCRKIEENRHVRYWEIEAFLGIYHRLQYIWFWTNI